MDPKQLRKIIKEELEPVKKAFKEELEPVKKELESVKKTQKEHTEKIDALTEEMFTVHQLASTTLDVVKGRYEKNKREIDEIKDHLNLPKEPYFGD